LSDQADPSIIENPNAITALLNYSRANSINYISLNPIIMPVGELRNRFAQEVDLTAHNIDIIGRSLVPMAGSLSITDNTSTNQDNLFFGLNLKDQNDLNSDLDWNSYAFDNKINQPSTIYPLMNQRFLALRGPLVISGWGFDTEGFPVPNASGEPKLLNDDGYPLKIKDLNDLAGGFENYPGVIVGKNQEIDQSTGKWTPAKKEDKFYKGWGQRPDLWPVGPVDLRWDATRKVWTTVSDIVFADVQLEDDLVPPKAARAFLNAVDKEHPLPNNLRRLVFVRDPSETYGAPRGAKLLCKYDKSSGFYEPISRQNIIASGLIQSNNRAIIFNAYAKGYNAEIGEMQPPDRVQVSYNNALNYPVIPNKPGIFVYLLNQWVLMSSNNCDI
jgi:hypothetical protein